MQMKQTLNKEMPLDSSFFLKIYKLFSIYLGFIGFSLDYPIFFALFFIGYSTLPILLYLILLCLINQA